MVRTKQPWLELGSALWTLADTSLSGYILNHRQRVHLLQPSGVLHILQILLHGLTKTLGMPSVCCLTKALRHSPHRHASPFQYNDRNTMTEPLY